MTGSVVIEIYFSILRFELKVGGFMKRIRFLCDIIIIIFGNFLYAAGVAFFILPSGLITGGTTGIALSVNHFMGLPVSYFILGFNICMFLLGVFIENKRRYIHTSRTRSRPDYNSDRCSDTYSPEERA